jgi:hypothetical protein
MLNNIIAPCVTADPGEPGTLIVSDGGWSGSAAVTCSYQWRLDGGDIPGATGTTYTPDAAQDAGHTVSCYVAAQDTAGNVGALLSNGVVM